MLRQDPLGVYLSLELEDEKHARKLLDFLKQQLIEE
jgi:hypothetical protein